MGWLSIIGSLVGLGDSITKVTGQIADTKVALAKASNDKERIAAEERLGQLQAQQAVLIEESKHTSANVYMRFGFALPIIIILWKILVWDQCLGLGSTPALGKDVWNLIYIVAGFYFVQSITQMLKK